jgi:hypothetical protein
VIYTHAIAALVALVIGTTGAWKVQSWRFAATEAARLEHEAEVRRFQARQADTAAGGHEADRVQIQTEFKTIFSEVERVVEKPIYRDVCFDSDGLRLLESATRGGAATGKPAPAVP